MAWMMLNAATFGSGWRFLRERFGMTSIIRAERPVSKRDCRAADLAALGLAWGWNSDEESQAGWPSSAP